MLPETKWAQANLPQCAAADLASGMAEVTTFVRRRRAVPFPIDGVNPGRYWVKVVADWAEPLSDDANETTFHPGAPGAGDYESAKSAVIDVKSGATADVGAIACKRRVED